MSWFSFQPENDIDKGRQALVYFHNESLKYPNYSYTFEELLIAVGKSHQDIFLDGFGFAVTANDMSDSKVKMAMEALAHKTMGNIPSNNNTFFKALSDAQMELSPLDYIKATPEVLFESVKDIGAGVKEFGDSTITTLKSLNAILPLAIVGGVLFVFISKVRKAA